MVDIKRLEAETGGENRLRFKDVFNNMYKKLIIMDEGEIRNVTFDKAQKDIFVIGVKTPDSKIWEMTVNKTSMRNLSKEWTSETKQWVGKTVAIVIETFDIAGESKQAVILKPETQVVKPA